MGTPHCKLLQLSTAPPPPVHPEIRVILGHQTVIIPCFWKRLVAAEELFPDQSIEGHQLDSSLSLDPAMWVIEWTVLRIVIKMHIPFPRPIPSHRNACWIQAPADLGSCLARSWVSCMSLDWARPSSEPQFSLCAMRLLHWISGPHTMPKGNGKTEQVGFPLSISPTPNHGNFAFTPSRFVALKYSYGRKKKKILLLKKSIKARELDRLSSMLPLVLTSCALRPPHRGRMANAHSWSPFDYFYFSVYLSVPITSTLVFVLWLLHSRALSSFRSTCLYVCHLKADKTCIFILIFQIGHCDFWDFKWLAYPESP